MLLYVLFAKIPVHSSINIFFNLMVQKLLLIHILIDDSGSHVSKEGTKVIFLCSHVNYLFLL